MRVLLAIAILLSGCATPAAEPVPVAEAPVIAPTLVHCVVVDGQINPIPNATVRLVQPDHLVLTDPAGKCAWPDEIPRPYTAEASAAGFLPVRLDITDDLASETIRFQLQPDTSLDPYTSEQKFDGLIACSVRLPTGGFNDGCGAFGDDGLGSTQRTRLEFDEGNLDWVQTELAWTANGPTSQSLCTRAKEADLYPIGDVCGPPNIVRYLDDVQVTADAIDRGQWFEYIVFPDEAAPGVGGVVVQQGFQLFVHAFYNQQPTPGWTFGADGAP